MAEPQPAEYLVECFWPGVREADLADVDRRVMASLAELGAAAAVRYLGCLLMPQDEVVFCRFEGAEAAVRRAVERADIRFERIVPAARSPGSAAASADQAGSI